MFSFGNNNGFQQPTFQMPPGFVNPAQAQQSPPSVAFPAVKSALIDAPTTELNTLLSGQFLRAFDREIYLVMQQDGNLVLYRSNNFVPNQAVWSTNTFNQGRGPYRLTMQSDGNAEQPEAVV